MPVIAPVLGVQAQPRRQCADDRVGVRCGPTSDRHRPAVKSTPTSPTVLIAEQFTDSAH